MNYQVCVFQLILEKIQNLPYNDDLLNKGIESYIKKEQIETLVGKAPTDEDKEDLIRIYMIPLLKMPEKYIVAYFENYDALEELKLVSNAIANEAVRAFHKEKAEEQTDDLEEKLTRLLSKLYKVEALQPMMKMEISENILDLDFIRGKTDKKSIRLIKRMKMENGTKR